MHSMDSLGIKPRLRLLVSLLLLVPLLSAGSAAASVVPSSHACDGNDIATRLCRFSNLLVVKGQLLYVSDAPVVLPGMSGYRPGYKAHGPPIQTVSSQKAQQLLDGAESRTTVDKAALVFRMHYENWGHHVLDITATTHRLLCSTLQLCNYDADSLRKLTLVFFDDFPKHQGNFQRIWECYSSNPPVYINKPEFSKRAYILRDVAAGWRFLSLFDPGWVPEHSKTYYDRVWKCFGLDTAATVRGIQPRKVTFIQRPFYESKKARSFVNIYDLMPLLQQKHPDMLFEVQTLGNKKFDQVISIFHNSSVVFAVSGAAMGNAIFMRKGSVYVDIGPAEYHHDFVTWALGNLGSNAQVKVFKYSVSEPRLKPLRWELIAESPHFDKLSKEDVVNLMRHHRCPPAIESYCKADWLYTKADYVLAPHAAEHWLKLALQHISGLP